MDKQETTHVEITAGDVDQTGTVSPRRMIQLLVLAGMERNRLEGGGKGPLREKFGAAWMFRRILMRQELPVRVGDQLTGFGYSRTMLDNEILIRGEFRREGALVAQCDLAMVPVNLAQRQKLKPAEVECLYRTTAANELDVFPRLGMVADFPYEHEKNITVQDCDENANHFASHNYADLVCRETGYWDGPYRMVRRMQIDYVKECMPGEHISLGAVERDGAYTVQGIHDNGKPCFNAFCVYE